jgi:hypothetical protein
MKKQSKYKISDNLYKCECGREFNKSQSLNAHFSHCDYHHKCLGTERKGHFSEIHHSMGWELTKTPEEIKECLSKGGKTLRKKFKTGELIPSWLGKHHSEETKDKIRITQAKNHKILETGPLYNKKSIEYINQLNKDKGWCLQHAENGGEITCAGYYLDGYDKNLNIAFEYDEPKHYKDKENNILRDYDVHRMNRIKEILGCTFWRYNEYLNLLYKY